MASQEEKSEEKSQAIALRLVREFFSKAGNLDDCFVGFGALLGGVRNKRFAGAPGDVDLIILLKTGQKANKLIDILKACGFEIVHDNTATMRDYIVARMYGMTLDLRIYRRVNFFGFGLVFRLAELEGWRMGDFKPERSIDLYQFSFPAPKEAERMLRQWYGPDWLIPRRFESFNNMTKKEVIQSLRTPQRKLLYLIAKALRYCFIKSLRFRKFWLGV